MGLAQLGRTRSDIEPLTIERHKTAEERIEALGSEEDAVRKEAAGELLAMGPGVLELLRSHANHENPRVREEVQGLIDRITPLKTLEFWTYAAADDDYYWSEVKRIFEAENPGVVVRMVTDLPGRNLQQKMNLRFIAGNPPDVMILNDWWTAALNKEGMLLPLEEFIANDPAYKTEHFPQSMVDDGYVGDTRFSAPYYGGYACLMYRTDLFRKAGVEPPRTWEELVSVGQTLKRELDMEYPFGLAPISPFYMTTFIWQNGGEIVDAHHREVKLDEPEAIGAVQFVHDLMYKYEIVNPGLASGTNVEALWAAGDIAMMYGGAWNFGQMDKDYPQYVGKWDVAPLPAGRQYTTFYGGQHLLIPNGSTHPELAWKFIVLLTRPDMQKLMADELGRPPANLQCYDDPEFRDEHPFMTKMRPWMVQGRNYRFAPYLWDIWNTRFKGDVLEAVMPDPNADIPTVMKNAVKEMQDVADGYWRRHGYFFAGKTVKPELGPTD